MLTVAELHVIMLNVMALKDKFDSQMPNSLLTFLMNVKVLKLLVGHFGIKL